MAAAHPEQLFVREKDTGASTSGCRMTAAICAEHARLADAVLSRDMKLASERMTEHLRLTEI